MKRIIFIMTVALLLGLGLVNAITQQDINEAKRLIDSKMDCKNLSDSQLEIIGEYYMEQMHPGEAHEFMHKMMGLEEGSGAEERFHIQMARSLYCGEPGGMMGSGGMMGMTNMMGNYPLSHGYSNYGYWSAFWMVFLIAAIVLIALFIHKYLIKKSGSSETPLGILKRRFARGEIAKKQFDDMKKELEE